MAADNRNAPDAAMDAASLYREEIVTDRKVGTIRVLVPVTPEGTPDAARKTLFTGEAQIMTNMGALPVSFDIEADNLAAAIEKFGPGAEVAVQQTMRELQEMRRESASSLVIPEAGSAALANPNDLGRGGRIRR